MGMIIRLEPFFTHLKTLLVQYFVIVHKTILDTMLYSKENRNFGICIKIVLNMQFLTFVRGIEKKKELSQRDLALSLCCLGRIRTLTGGTRIRRATITPQGKMCRFV